MKIEIINNAKKKKKKIVHKLGVPDIVLYQKERS